VGVSTTLWLAIGAQIYPPNKHAQVVDVRGCQMFRDYHNPNSTRFLNVTESDIPDVIKGSGLVYPALDYKTPE